MAPSVSVIIPTYNRCDFLEDAIQSVLNQTFEDFELIVVDDGSTDNTEQMLDNYMHDVRVKYVYQTHSGSGGAARNKGIESALGSYVAFLDSDDLWLPEKLGRQVETLKKNPDISVVYCACLIQQIDTSRKVLSERVLRRRHPMDATLYEKLIYACVITGSSSSTLIRARCFAKVGLFDAKLPGSDIDMWRRLALSHKFLYLDEPLVQIRKHTTNMSKSPDLMRKHAHLYRKKLKSDLPPEYRFHLVRLEALEYFHACKELYLQKRPWLIFRFLPGLLWFSVLHPGFAATLVLKLWRRWKLRISSEGSVAEDMEDSIWEEMT